MKEGPGASRLARAATTALVLFAFAAWTAHESPAGNGVPAGRDEFGVVPEEPHDKDLALPDPVLDRTWPGPKPGEGRRAVETGRREDEERVPEPEQEAPAKPSGMAPDAYDVRAAPRPPAALIGPDGRRDPGSPAPELDPALPDVLGKDAPDLSDLEREEAAPSPYAKGGDPAGDEGGDGGDLGGGGE